MTLFNIVFTAAASAVSQPQTAGNVQPQGWVIIIVLFVATVIWFFTRNKRG